MTDSSQDYLVAFYYYLKTHWYLSPTWMSLPLVSVGGAIIAGIVTIYIVDYILAPNLYKYFKPSSMTHRVLTLSAYTIIGLLCFVTAHIWGVAHALGIISVIKLLNKDFLRWSKQKNKGAQIFYINFRAPTMFTIGNLLTFHWYASEKWWTLPLVSIGVDSLTVIYIGPILSLYTIALINDRILEPLLHKYYKKSRSESLTDKESQLLNWSANAIIGTYAIVAAKVFGIAHGLGILAVIRWMHKAGKSVGDQIH